MIHIFIECGVLRYLFKDCSKDADISSGKELYLAGKMNV